MAKKGKEKDIVPVHNLPNYEIGITVIIDETTPHDLKYGDQYVVGATVLNNKDVRKFGEIAEIRYKGRELKFHDTKDPELAIEILDEASKLGKSYYSVTTTKPKDRKWSKKEDRNVHRNSVKRIVEDVSDDEESDIHLIIDYNTKSKSGTIRRIISSVSKKEKITYDIPRSEESFQLMTNDFPVGSMGRSYNRNDDTYVNRLGKKVKRSRLNEEDAIKDLLIDFEE